MGEEMSDEAFETKVQRFFEEYRTELRKPHFGGAARTILEAVLIRAQEAGLYQPRRDDADPA